ncbi:MAG: adenine deaminase C-terminal domain-containing protein, partial [Pseudomonadota bacterium]
PPAWPGTAPPPAPRPPRPARAEALSQAMQAAGCTLNNAFMQHSLLALVVIPSLRISDQGLIDVDQFEKTEVIVETV